MDGKKLYVDASLIEADAAKESVIKAAPPLIAALKQAYRATESKLEETSTPESYQAVNDRMMSQSDPDAACVRQGGGQSRPRYKHHRVIDDSKGVITAIETTPGSIAENKKLMGLVDQHENNTNCQAQIVIADHKYGTTENFVECQARGITTHMGDAGIKAHSGHDHTIFGDEAFAYDRVANIYRCPADQSPGRAACILFAERSRTRLPPECVRDAWSPSMVLALPMDALCKDTKNKRP